MKAKIEDDMTIIENGEVLVISFVKDSEIRKLAERLIELGMTD